MQRSYTLKGGPEKAASRALLYSVGIKKEEMNRPFNRDRRQFQTKLCPVAYIRSSLRKAVKRGVREAGGVPFEFNTITVCDGMAQGHVGMKYSLPSREIIAGIVRDYAGRHISLTAQCSSTAVINVYPVC